MKFRALMFATLLVGIPSASLACGSANSDHFDEDERLFLSELEDEQIEYLARNLNLAQNDLVLFPGAAFVRHIDLDRDGTNEICLSLQTTATCSNGVGVCRILVLKDWSTEPLLFFTGHLLVAERSPEDSVATLIGVWAAPGGKIWRARYEYSSGNFSTEPPTAIGSWAQQRCDLEEYEPRMLCSSALVEEMGRGN